MKKFLVILAAPFVLAACSATSITSAESTIEADVAAACGFVPLASSVIEIAGDVAGIAVPTASVLVGLSSTALAAIEKDLCSATTAPASELESLFIPAVLMTSTPNATAKYIGKSHRGHRVYGWRVKK